MRGVLITAAVDTTTKKVIDEIIAIKKYHTPKFSHQNFHFHTPPLHGVISSNNFIFFIKNRVAFSFYYPMSEVFPAIMAVADGHQFFSKQSNTS